MSTESLILLLHGFNPHTHAGCDFLFLLFNIIFLCFNPHTHAGCDANGTFSGSITGVSIHTPTQGVTPSSDFKANLCKSFNPHTHAGCDYIKVFQLRQYNVSIHTPTQGVTLYLITYYKSANLIHCYANHHYYSTS